MCIRDSLSNQSSNLSKIIYLSSPSTNFYTVNYTGEPARFLPILTATNNITVTNETITLSRVKLNQTGYIYVLADMAYPDPPRDANGTVLNETGKGVLTLANFTAPPLLAVQARRGLNASWRPVTKVAVTFFSASDDWTSVTLRNMTNSTFYNIYIVGSSEDSTEWAILSDVNATVVRTADTIIPDYAGPVSYTHLTLPTIYSV
eukprot:TRINITY_DN5994_c0_g1_i3.p1 TRINITY_DN5994_c0_g1~~TRINITY_DN5994_c0_g1_i3.p1  ORF type:complete len:223 (-),score=47.81 TRINITY_DN5994_c0_g1_i3:33-644(-)